MTARDDFCEAMRQAAVYHADEGTSGWLLSEDRFAAILAAADAYAAAGQAEMRAELDAELAGLRDPSMRSYVNWGVGFDADESGGFSVESYDSSEHALEYLSFYGPGAFLVSQSGIVGNWLRAETPTGGAESHQEAPGSAGQVSLAGPAAPGEAQGRAGGAP